MVGVSRWVVGVGLLVGARSVILVELTSSAESHGWLLVLDLVARWVAAPKFRLAGVSRLVVGIMFVGWWLGSWLGLSVQALTSLTVGCWRRIWLYARFRLPSFVWLGLAFGCLVWVVGGSWVRDFG